MKIIILTNKLIFIFLLIFTSCYKDDTTVNITDNNNKNTNQWIYNIMDYYYYWENELPNNIENLSVNPVDFYKSLLYNQDRFSNIFIQNTNDYSLSMVESYGFESLFGNIKINNFTQIGGIVLYVYPNSMADKVGIKRGDIFIAINDISLTEENLNDLYIEKQATFSFIKLDGYDELIIDKKNIIREKMNIDPLLVKKIINIHNINIGYVCYNRFIEDNGDGSLKYIDDVLKCFSDFKKNNINELIVDLRYNPGGLIHISALLSSLIVPNVDDTKVALQLEYNKNISNTIEPDKNSTTLYFSLYPDSYVGNNINRVYFIVGSMTASASEAVINALLPYMDVFLVGETTYGKNYGSMLFSNNQTDCIYSIMPIVMKSYNSIYESNYDKGFTPDYRINEFEYQFYDLGDIQEPLLNYIINLMCCSENKPKTKGSYPSLIFHPHSFTESMKPLIYEFCNSKR